MTDDRIKAFLKGIPEGDSDPQELQKILAASKTRGTTRKIRLFVPFAMVTAVFLVMLWPSWRNPSESYQDSIADYSYFGDDDWNEDVEDYLLLADSL
ncbi:MAG: hypothetical protein HRU19_23245 [Pseudobacteriovorax sp.]|nr:hypothetical protein [Pseudobacteriovorax sp.]